jgi:hypothetical protein
MKCEENCILPINLVNRRQNKGTQRTAKDGKPEETATKFSIIQEQATHEGHQKANRTAVFSNITYSRVQTHELTVSPEWSR